MSDNFHYFITPNGCTITEYTGEEKTVIIPEKINGYKVHAIGGHAFAQNELIEKVIISNGISLIDIYAFAHCKKLNTLILPESLRKISHKAFHNCPSLKEIRFNGKKNDGEKFLYALLSLMRK